ncbi:MAG: hypothetical protein Q4B64_08315 [Spirochaetales bacterium]|nr:hypothetical protein [Spirochaetales bacterium]
MKTTNKIMCMAAALVLSAGAFAQDYEEEPFEPKLTIGGVAEVSARAWVDEDNRDSIGNMPVDAAPSLKLNFDYEGSSSIFTGKLKFNKDSLQKGNYKDILDEFKATAILDNWTLEAGKMRLVWGKTDKVHVLDNFNANDYSDFLIPDYNDRRIAEPMLRAVYATPFASNLKFEAVYTPVMTPDRLGTGCWTPSAVNTLTQNVEKAAGTALATALAAPATAPGNALVAASSAMTVKNVSALSSDSSILYPDTNKLKYGQAGFRTTFTVGSLDLGASYYYGHLKQPSFKALKFNSAMKSYLSAGSLSEDEKFLAYDKVQIFGLEGAFITPYWLLSLNSRFEVAYNMTEDTAGDDPFVHNNSVNWVVGFDRDLPIHNLNLNIQTQGKYIMNGKKIKDGLLKTYDVDADPNDCFMNNKIIVDITDTWNYENVKLDIKGIYGIERKDFILMPSLSTRVAGNMTITASGLYMWCKEEKDSEFVGWQTNSFAQLSVKYNF